MLTTGLISDPMVTENFLVHWCYSATARVVTSLWRLSTCLSTRKRHSESTVRIVQRGFDNRFWIVQVHTAAVA